MGHTLTQWTAKIAELVRDPAGKDFSPDQVVTVGLSPALTQYAVDRPRRVITEQAGTGSAYLDLPAEWSPGYSVITGVEYPARQNPPETLDPQSYLVVRDPTDVAVDQVLLLGSTPAASSYVRLSFTAAWPLPSATADDDMIDDVAFEAVAALAASFCCVSLASEAARVRIGAMLSDFADERERARQLMAAADAFREAYERALGIGSDGGVGGGSSVPAWGSFDLDPASSSLFHGGRR